MKLDRISNTTVVIAELSHIFCCGLPILFAILGSGLQLGIGGGFLFMHSVIHSWEVPILIGSGVMLAVGFGLQYLSFQMDCRSSGCHHEPCAPKKMRVSRLFIFAILLYVVNVSVYIGSGHGNAEESAQGWAAQLQQQVQAAQ